MVKTKNNQCEYKGEKLFSSQPYFYSTSYSVSNTYRFLFEFDEEINYEALRFAADQCYSRYPYLMVKTKKTWNEIRLVHNEQPIVVRKTDKAVKLNSKDVNDHLIALTFFDHQLVFSAFHGLLDGTGAFMFLRTLFYYYIKIRYQENPSADGIRLIEDEITSEEYIDPFLALSQKNCLKLPIHGHGIKKPFRVATDTCIKRTAYHTYYVRLSQKNLIDYCRENDSSPSSLFSLLIARAIRELNPYTKEPIICGLDQNLRSALNAEKSHHSLVRKSLLEYDERLEKLPYDRQNTAIRGRIILDTDPDYTKEELLNQKKFYQLLRRCPFLFMKRNLIRTKKQHTDNRNCTYVVSYTGRFSNRSIEKHINSFFIDVDAPESGIILELTSLNENFFVSFMQEWQEKIYFNAFCKKMEEIGISYEVIYEGEPVIPQMAY